MLHARAVNRRFSHSLAMVVLRPGHLLQAVDRLRIIAGPGPGDAEIIEGFLVPRNDREGLLERGDGVAEGAPLHQRKSQIVQGFDMGRFQLQCAAIGNDGLIDPPQLFERDAQIIVRVGL